MGNHARLLTHFHRRIDLLQPDPFLDPFEHVRISRFHAETDAVASGFGHQVKDLLADRIHAGKSAPGKFQRSFLDSRTDFPDPFLVGGKEIIGNINAVETVTDDLFDLIQNQAGVSFANFGADHLRPRQKMHE